MTSAHTLFAAAERLEMLAAEVYRLLAERFASREPVRAVFWRLHQEEVQHAARVRLLAAQYRNDPGLFASAALFRGTPDPVELVGEVTVAVRELEAGAWGDDLDEVKARVVEMERRCVSLHSQFMVAGAPREISSFFEELARHDEEHERLLGEL
jgi:rubrerythrin